MNPQGSHPPIPAALQPSRPGGSLRIMSEPSNSDHKHWLFWFLVFSGIGVANIAVYTSGETDEKNILVAGVGCGLFAAFIAIRWVVDYWR